MLGPIDISDCSRTCIDHVEVPSPHLPASWNCSSFEIERTNGFNGDLDPRTHNLVPTVDTPYQPSRPLEAASAAEWMRKAGIGHEVFLYCGALGCGWGLCEEVDYVGNFCWGVLHFDVIGVRIWGWMTCDGGGEQCGQLEMLSCAV